MSIELKMMDPFCPNEEENSKLQQFTQLQFDALLQDFDEFENTFLRHSANPMNADPLCPNEEDNSKLDQQFAHHHFATLLQDFDEFENTFLPPYSIKSGEAGGGRVEDSLVMKHGFSVGSSSGMNAWRYVGEKVTLEKAPWRRRYRKRCKNEVENSLRREHQKIKNRVAAAQSFAKKQAYTLQLQSQIERLNKENELHKKLVLLLEGNQKIDRTQRRLQRTISGPI